MCYCSQRGLTGVQRDRDFCLLPKNWPSQDPGSSGRRNCGAAWCLPDPPLEGPTREGALGGTEMQDRLHILEDLNMLYIRQMALSLEVMTPLLDYTLLPLAS